MAIDSSVADRILIEDDIRTCCWSREYDPVSGTGCFGRRVRVTTPYPGEESVLVPEGWTDRPLNDYTAWQRGRCRADFEYWCAKCVTIKRKSGGYGPLILNAPQRRLLALLEEQRLGGRPIRAIILKARQWGGSTLVQTYMAWIQSCHRTDWHSVICAQQKDTASTIRGMYSKILECYPEHLWEGDAPPRFKPFEGSSNIREIAGRGCRVALCSSENPDAIRGTDFAMAHLSETAYWRSGPVHNAENIFVAVSGSILMAPYSLVVMESTANGVGNYFHTEWLRSCRGESDKLPIFVPWFEIELYRATPPDARAFVERMGREELDLWNMGLALSQIYWYSGKKREYAAPVGMCAEFPTTAEEAFVNSGNPVFGVEDVEAMRRNCREPRWGDMAGNGTFTPLEQGPMGVWCLPERNAEYVVAVDIGGRSAAADWSVIAVLGFREGLKPEVVAQWRGHIDHDLLAVKARQIAQWYNNALLVVESNTLECEGDFGLFVINRLSESYQNLYRRQVLDIRGNPDTSRLGFHTNRSTKALIITNMVEAVREGKYIERDHRACNEMVTYEELPGPVYAAKEGNHDDIIITRAIALYVARARNIGNRPQVPSAIWQGQKW